MSRILIVDDDAHIREIARFALEKAGYGVLEAADGQKALSLCQEQGLDLVVLDIVLPEMDGLEVCRKIRATSNLPIVFLSSRDDEIDRVLGLELGADDYVTKPFSPRELVARVKAVLRRVQQPTEGAGKVLTHGPLRLDLERHQCFWGEHELSFTATEFDLLQTLLARPGKVYTRGELVDRAWGLGHHITERTVDSHVRRVRKKFAALGVEPIETVYGVGYRMAESPA